MRSEELNARLKEAKRALYSELLEMPVDDISRSEADLMFALVKDPQIQEIHRYKRS